MENTLMSTMDEYCAPQWTDLQSSPNVPSEDFFQREHLEHERQANRKLNKDDIFSSTAFDLLNNDASLQSAPVKIISPSRNKKVEIQETTYSDVLCDAMKQLQLSAKMKKTRTMTATSVKTTELFKTPVTLNSMNTQLNISSIKCKQTTKNYTVKGKNRTSTPKWTPSSETNNTSIQSKSISQPNFNVTPCRSAKKDARTSNKKTPKVIRRFELSDTSIQNDNTLISNKSLKTEIYINNENVQGTDNISSCKESSLQRLPPIIITEATPGKSMQKDDVNESALKITVTTKICKNNEEDNQIEEQKNDKDIFVQVNNDDSFVTIHSENSQDKQEETDILKMGLRSKVSLTKQRRSIVSKARRSFGNQINRRSLSKPIKPPSHQSEYVSLAEAVSKFQSDTPKRFYSVNDKRLQPAAVTKLKQAKKLTVPMSPVLATKSRIRPAVVPNKTENIKQNQVKTNSVRVIALKGPVPLKKTFPKKPPTIPEPFHLTEIKKPSNTSAVSQEPGCSKNITQEKFVAAVGSASDSAIVIEKQEALFFGVPVKSNQKKKTVAIPFSFENRHKELQNKKEEKLKQLQTEKDKTKLEFHARPVPKYSKSVSQTNEQMKKSFVEPCPFSFEKRDKLRLEKKEHVKKIIEEDKKMRMFHANPVPPIKPVLVQNTSKTKPNEIQGEKHIALQKIQSKEDTHQKVIKCTSTKSNTKTDENKTQHKQIMDKSSEQENRNPNIVENITNRSHERSNKSKKNVKINAANLELNTDKRAKVRRDFDEKLKQREHERELMRQKEVEYRIAKEKAERAELRKMAEIRANPMPVFKPISIIKSTKPLTIPESPAWASKIKSKHATTK